MAIFSIPDSSKNFSQPNSGDVFGSLNTTYGIDLETNRGRIQATSQAIKLLDTNDDAQLDGYVAQFVRFDNKLWGISDEVFRTSDADNPTGTWIQDTDTDSPAPGNTVTDMCVFDGMLLALDGNDIDRNPGDGDWDSWWVGLRGQAALSTGQRFFMKVGPNDRLYIVDGGNKIYNVAPNGSGTGTITKTGDGTLDFSYQPYKITCMEFTSSRMFVGFENTAGGEGGVIEWDLSLNANTPNRVHKVGATAVRAIAIWNDVPYAVLSNGSIKVFDGGGFSTLTGIQFPYANSNEVLADDFIHPNGWAIIDNLPHFLVTGRDIRESQAYDQTSRNAVQFPGGVWCMDPQVGLYHRFSLGAGESTQYDYGQPSLRAVGALHAVENGSTKFLASYEYYEDTTTTISAISYEDTARTKPGRSFFITQPFEGSTEAKKYVETIHKKLQSGEKIKLFYRQEKESVVTLDGVWNDTTHFHTTDTATDVNIGDVLLVKTGSGAGSLFRISNKETTTGTTVLTIDEANSLSTANDTGTVAVMNFKWMGTIDGTGTDNHNFDIPSADERRRVQLLIEMRQVASNTMELDSVIISV